MGRKKIKKKAAGDDEQICRRTLGKLRCKLTKKKQDKLKNGSGDGEGANSSWGLKSSKEVIDPTLDGTGGIQPPTIDTVIESGSGPDLEKQLPLDEERCRQIGGRGKYKYRCKSFKMGLGASADDDTVAKSNYCEKHYNYYAECSKKRKKRTSGDGEDDDTCDDSANVGTKTKKKKKEMENMKLPPDEQRCCLIGGAGIYRYRCKNFRMALGAAADDDSVPKSRHCEKHYIYFANRNQMRKKKSGDQGEETKRRNGDTIVAGDSAKIRAKRKHVERTQGSGELKSSTKTVIETRTSKRRKYVKEGDSFVAETSNQLATDENSDSHTIVEGGSANHGRKRKYAEKLSGELESLAGTRKTTFTNENEQTLADATGRWKKLLSCLQSKKNEKATRGYAESCISNLESLVFKSGKESLILRSVELDNSERVESEVMGLQNDITQSCEKPTDESNKSTLNAEASIGGRTDSHAYEYKAKDKVLNVCDVGTDKHHESESEFPKYSAMNISSATLHLSTQGQNVEDGKGLGSSSNRPPQHGSSSQDHLEMSTERFANLVLDDGGGSLSESEEFGSSLVSKNSLGDPMDMLAMKNWNRNKEEMKWKSEDDMLSSFEEDVDLCVKAICALYRQEISEDKITPKGLYFQDDTVRCTTLAKFLMDNDCKGDLKKSVAELEKFDSKAVGDCKKLVRRYSMHLFYIYKDRKDPFFLPVTTDDHGDQTSK